MDEMDRLLAGGLPFCNKPKECGHKCAGVKHEEKCLPCLKPECATRGDSSSAEKINLPSHNEVCNICFTGELREEPSIQLGCGHIFHAKCIKKLI